MPKESINVCLAHFPFLRFCKKTAWCGLLAGLFNCQSVPPNPPPAFVPVPAEKSGIRFANPIREDARHNVIDYAYVYNGGGVGIGDLNNDGLPDLVLTGNQVSSRLYLNKGNLQFTDVTEAAGMATQGWCTGVTLADINADGWLDIYICRAGNLPPDQRRNLLFINQKTSAEKPGITFTEQARQYGIDDAGWGTQGAFFDYDKDGDLDLYLLNATNDDRYPNRIKPKVLDGTSLANDKLYRNNAVGNGKQVGFTEIHREAGILDDGWGLGLSVNDFDGDGWEDLYVSNDFLANDLLYMNNRNGTFSERAQKQTAYTSHFSMGNDAADINNDGKPDVVVADMLPSTNRRRKQMAGVLSNTAYDMALANGYAPQYMRNTLQLNRGTDKAGRVMFSEIGQLAGIHATDWSWNPLLADFDNDGWRDLFITNGYRHDVTDMDFIVYNNQMGQQNDAMHTDSIIKASMKKQAPYPSANRFFRNRGDLAFTEKTAAWTDSTASFANGAATADLDNDGDLDLVVNNIDAPATLYENRTPTANFLALHLRAPAPNTFGLGAKVTVFASGKIFTHHHAVTRGYQSCSGYAIHFGLGRLKTIDSMQVIWPDGTQQTLTHVKPNQTLTIQKSPGFRAAVVKPAPTIPLFSIVENSDFIHQEDDYDDFGLEPLLPYRFSQEGPFLTTGDVNGDGREDFFAGGASGYAGTLFMQRSDGSFAQRKLGAKLEEDAGCLLFDADQDNDLDLYVASGGNQFETNSQFYQDRLYLNDGKGRFSLATNYLPKKNTPSSCVKASDMDHDGDLDLFVGGRREILRYGSAGTSQLLRNNGTGFTDVTAQWAPNLRHIGMVTDAAWADVNGDGWQDLLVAGEWMPLTVFRNQTGKFTKTELPHTSGWWQCLTTADLDHDGDMDFAAGNMGLNQGFNISRNTPLRVYTKDFDGNGYADPILTYYIDNQEVPLPSRDELTKQIPLLRRKFNTYASYAQVTWPGVFDFGQRQDAEIHTVEMGASGWAANDGQGNFTWRPFPVAAQLSPVRCWLTDDVNRDGHPDLIGVGNTFAPTVTIGRMDALSGIALLGDGKGNWRAVEPEQSGFYPRGVSSQIMKLTGKTPRYVVARNQAALLIYAPNHPKMRSQ